ncbi:NADH-quinone oxidoreductase subunit K [Streptomyces sp. INA 01156]
MMRIVLGFILLGHGTNLLLLVASGTPAGPGTGRAAGEPGGARRPAAQAMALTSIVITFGLTAFLMALAYRSWRLSGSDEVRDDVEDRRIDIALQRAGSDEVSGTHDGDESDGDESDGDGPGGGPGGDEPDHRDHGTAPGDHR